MKLYLLTRFVAKRHNGHSKTLAVKINCLFIFDLKRTFLFFFVGAHFNTYRAHVDLYTWRTK